MFNYNANRLVVVSYPMGAGGKFLINCLSVSKDACLQDWNLHDLTPKQKKQLIFDRLSTTSKGTWNDLNLGGFMYFEDNLAQRTTTVTNALKNSVLLLATEQEQSLNSEYQKIVSIIKENRYHFHHTHNEEEYVHIINTFPNCRTINFVNCAQLRRKSYTSTFTDTDFDLRSPDLSIDLNIQSEFTFDVSNYKTKKDTLDSVQKFYEHLNMKDFDSIFIAEYYEKWIAHIT